MKNKNSNTVMSYGCLGVFIILLTFTAYGCFKQAEIRGPLPEIVWPDPPETPRISFVNSISGPDDMNIGEGAFGKLIRFFKGAGQELISSPYGLETDAAGRLFVVDTFSRRVHVFDPAEGDYYTFPRERPSLMSPIDIALDGKGNIYVTDSKEAVVRVFKERGKTYVTEIGRGYLKRPTGIAVNEKTGELLVVDTLGPEVVRFDLEGYTLKGIIGKSGAGAGMFNNPTNIFVSTGGDIYISDSLNFRVQIFTPRGEFSGSFGRPGDSPGYFARPRGVAVDSDGNIYVVDALFDNVQIFNKEGALLLSFGGPGSKYGEFWLPSGIFIDGNDRVYVSDLYNKRVQVFQYMKAKGVSGK